MKKSMFKAFALAVLLPVGMAVTACGTDNEDAGLTAKTGDTSFSLTQMAEGQFFTAQGTMKDGLYKRTVSKDTAGTKNDMTCLVTVEKAFTSGEMLLESCDYVGADSNEKTNKTAMTSSPFKLDLLAKGKMTRDDGMLKNGTYQRIISKSLTGTKNDLPCAYTIKRAGTNHAKATKSCNWAAAHGM